MKRFSHQGERQKMKILACLEYGAMSAADIGNEIHLSRAGVTKHIAVMKAATPKRVHIENYDINTVGKPTPLYAAGDKPDAVYQHQTVIKSHHHALLSRAVMHLEASPRTTRELSFLMKMSVSGARNLINELKDMHWCYLSDYTPPIKRRRIPIFSLGVGKDKKVPITTRAERWKAEKRDEDLHERNLAKRRAKAMLGKARAKPQGIFAALGL